MIRKAVPEDVEQVARIYKDVYSEAPYFNTLEMSLLISGLREQIEKREFRVAEEANKEIVGFIVYSLLWYGGKTAYVQDLLVSKEFRGNGIAKSLMSTVESECRELGVERIVLDVNRKASKALKLYETLGYAENGTIEMEKELKDK